MLSMLGWWWSILGEGFSGGRDCAGNEQKNPRGFR